MLLAVRRILTVALVASAVLAAENGACAGGADDQFAIAAGHYNHRDWKLAVDEFRTFLAAYPNDRRANECVFFLAEALRQLGQFDEARRQFQTYAGHEPKGRHAAAALFGSAEAAYLAGDYRAAKPDLASFYQKHPDDPLNAFALPYLGDIALSAGDAATAARCFRDGLQRFPDGALQDECRFGLGRALHSQNQFQEAERLYAAVARKPGSPLADNTQFYLGIVQYAQGKFDQALTSFSAFEGRLAKSPWRPNARLNCGLALLKLDRPNEAIKQFDAAMATPAAEEAVVQQAAQGKVQAALQTKEYAAIDREVAEFEKRFPNSPLRNDMRRMLARSLIERKQPARAVALLETLVVEIPAGGLRQQDLETRYLLALGYEGLARYVDALAALQLVAEKAKGQLKSDAQLNVGTLLMALKRPIEAVAPLEAFLAGKPAGDVEAKALAALAICHARANQIDKAKTRYAELLEKYPHNTLIALTTERLADAAFDANDTVWAAELSKRLTETGASAKFELKGNLNLGWSQFKAGKLVEATATLDDLLKKNPPEAIAAEAAFLRGRILHDLGRNEAALAMYNSVIERYSGSEHRCDALLAAARLQAKLKQPAAAAANYQRLATDYPRSQKLDAAVYEWAWLMLDLGKPEDATRLFERLHKECPQSRFWADATCRLALQALRRKDYQRAGALIDEVVAKKPAAADLGSAAEQPDAKVREYAMLLRGQLAVNKADWPIVREAFEALLKEYPRSQRRPVAEYWIAESYYRQADYAAAITRFQPLAQRTRQNREPWMAIIPLRHAQALAQQNQWNDAQTIAAQIEKDFPNFEQQYEVDYLLGRCFANRGEFDSARQAYKRALRSAAGEKTETAAMAQWMIGETYFHQKKYEDALRAYSGIEFVYDYPVWQAAALLQAGKCREKLGEPAKATEAYRKIMKSYPNSSFAKDAAERLARLEAATSPH
jgi:cellulose synthase operon protein C